MGTGWRGRTQLTGSKFSHIEILLVFNNANHRIEVAEVEEEEVATETTNGDNIAAYTKPTLPQIHEHFLDTISTQVQESVSSSFPPLSPRLHARISPPNLTITAASQHHPPASSFDSIVSCHSTDTSTGTCQPSANLVIIGDSWMSE